ncbi:cytochrome P450 [Schizopora paradoxa]|uniref:Cytochrome P450 n=1 Tax=Schizopora paradoxa TaxID=27342 RepID=A0A0H2RU38_9AGAM|nr:cytochrome P450 [Schizopora paradoxa]
MKMESLVHFVPIACSVWLVYLVIKYLQQVRNNKTKYPPGPKGFPVFGNILSMPKKLDWIQYQELGRTYGDIVFMKNPGCSTLVINSYEAAIELLDKRSNTYSSRPTMTMVTELEGWNFMLAWRRYNDGLKEARQRIHHFLQPRKVRNYEAIQLNATHKLLRDILRAPEGFLHHIRHAAGGIIMMFSYGHEVADEQDPFVELAERGLSELSDFGRFFFVDVFPILKYVPDWIPGAGFKKRANEVRKISTAMRVEPYNETKEALLRGSASPSMLSSLIEMNRDDEGNVLNEELISGYAASIYVAGADTTVSVVSTFVLAMVMHPQAQRRAHAELDDVIGKDTLPRFEDRNKLPYINAIIEECLRWQTITPLGLPHCTSQDDHYNGYFIPAGTIVHANLWCMLRNPEDYPQPDKFIPERWFAENGNPTPRLASKIAFGFGRRRCIGKAFAESSVFIAVASLLAAFNFEKESGESGQPKNPSGEYSEDFLRYPKPFHCKITPRSEKLEKVIGTLLPSLV